MDNSNTSHFPNFLRKIKFMSHAKFPIYTLHGKWSWDLCIVTYVTGDYTFVVLLNQTSLCWISILFY